MERTREEGEGGTKLPSLLAIIHPGLGDKIEIFELSCRTVQQTGSAGQRGR